MIIAREEKGGEGIAILKSTQFWKQVDQNPDTEASMQEITRNSEWTVRLLWTYILWFTKA